MNANRSTTKYLRDARAIAAAWGVAVYNQTGQRKRQLAAVHEAMERPDFPKKQKPEHRGQPNAWPREEVVSWGLSHIKLSKDKRTVTLVETKAGDLPPQANPAAGDLFLKLTPEELKKANLERLQRNLLVHLGKIPGDPLQKFEIEELISNHLLPRTALDNNAVIESSPTDGGDEFTGGVEAVAAYIQLRFPGVICNKTDISRWQHMKFLPDGCTEQFPPSHNSGRNSKRKIDAWIIKYKKPSGMEQNLPGVDTTDYERETKKLNFLREQEEWKWRKQAMSDKFMETAIVRPSFEGFGTWIGWQQDKFIEDARGVRSIVAECVKSVFGATAEQLAVLDAALLPKLSTANDAMKTAADHHGDDLFLQLVADRKEAIQKAMKEI